MVTYKAFDKNLKCRGFQYEIGKEYECENAICCKTGFHSCKNPLECLNYYDITKSRFAKCEASGAINENSNDSKISSTKLIATKELSLDEFIKECESYLFKNCNTENNNGYEDGSQLAASGDWSKLAASGDWSKLAASGDWSQLAASGDWSQLAASGDNSVIASIGINSIAKTSKNSWIVLAEYKNGIIYHVSSEKVDGVNIKADTWYKLKNKKFVEVEL